MKPSASSVDLFDTLRDDIGAIAADIRRNGFRRALVRAFEGVEAFYLTAEDRRNLEAMRPVRRFIRRVSWLVKSLLLKLTPTRRLMLAAALFFIVIGGQRVQIATRELNISIRLPIISSTLLLAVLMLELKDKLTARNELEAGRQVQLAMTPAQSPVVPGSDVWLHTRPTNDVGGDLIDHLPIDERRHAIALGVNAVGA